MYEIIMLRLEKDKVVPLICNSMQIPDVMDFVGMSRGKDSTEIIDGIESNFDCKVAEVTEEDPFDLKKPENKPSLNYILYINYNNGSEQSLFGYPTLEHALIVGNKFLTKEGTVKIYRSEINAELWGSLELVRTLKYEGD